MIYLLSFLILAGNEFKVKTVEFHGNHTFSDKELRKVIRTCEGELYDEFQVNVDSRLLVNFYHSRGFKYVRITDWKKTIVDPDKHLVKCDIQIKEGIQQHIKDIWFEGNKAADESRLRRVIKMSSNAPVNNQKILLAKHKLLDFYADRGYAYVEVEEEIIGLGIDTLSPNVVLIFRIQEHGLVRFGHIRVRGQQKVRHEIIAREITFKKWYPYSLTQLRVSQARIYGTDLFESVRYEIKGMEEKADTVDVTFFVKESRPRWVSFGGGYSSPDRAWLDAGWGHSNLGNNGQKLSINCKYDLNPFRIEDLQRIELKLPYREPYFFNTGFKAELSPFYNLDVQNEDSSSYQLTSAGIQGRLGRYIGRYMQSFLSYNYEVIDRKGNVSDDGGVVNSLIYSLSWDTRNDVFYPRMGTILSFSLEYAGLGGDYRFDKLEMGGVLVSRFLHTVIVTRLKGGAIMQEAPVKRKFVLGGVNIVRGYPDMTYAELTESSKDWMLLSNIEMRIPMWKGFEVAYFIDAGNVWSQREDMQVDEIKVGAGLGLRYRTPIGPVRLDYGRRIVDSGDTKGRVYFGIGYMF
jgi:outer membrane protein insertion porin family